MQTTESRTYGNTNWIDQLTNINGTAITYDNLGNPLSWHNASSLTWEGRKLKTFTKTDGTVISYTYDENGIRTGKTVGSDSVRYILDGNRIIQEKHTDYALTFIYDDSNTLIGFNYDNGSSSADYYYGIDNFENINYIYDSNGNVVVTYKYDAWGKAISTAGSLASTIGTINPYRYKSYYFDSEIQMYYLQSRYYDASVQRFISADEPMLLGISGGIYSYNLNAYCENDPVNNYDMFGFWIINLKTGTVAIALDLILTVLAISVAFFAPAKALSWSRKLFSWAKKAFNRIINTISYVLADSLDTIMYELLKKYDSAGKVRISIGAAAIAWFISTLIDLTPGNIVANLIDNFDKDGKSGYIRF